MAELIIKIVCNLCLLFIGILFLISSYGDKKSDYYPKWFWISELALGIGNIIYSVTVWFS